MNIFGVRLGALIQNVFTSAKALSLAALILLAFTVGVNATAWQANFANGQFWRNAGWHSLHAVQVGVGGPTAWVNLLVILAVVQVGSLFSADAWNNITFTAGEVKNPRRNLPLSLVLGTGFVIAIYFLVSLAYLLVLPLHGDPHGATAVARGIQYAVRRPRGHGRARRRSSTPAGRMLMAGAILISTFGCANGMTLAGARVYYAMSQDGLFFKSVGKLHPKLQNARRRSARAGSVDHAPLRLRLLRPAARLHHLCRAHLLHSDHLSLFVLRIKQPDAARPYQGIRLSGAAGALHRDGRVDLSCIAAVQTAVHVAGAGAGAAGHSGLPVLVAPRNATQSPCVSGAGF